MKELKNCKCKCHSPVSLFELAFTVFAILMTIGLVIGAGFKIINP